MAVPYKSHVCELLDGWKRKAPQKPGLLKGDARRCTNSLACTFLRARARWQSWPGFPFFLLYPKEELTFKKKLKKRIRRDNEA